MSAIRPTKHGRDHREDGADPSVGLWLWVGTAGADGVDAELAANPAPYATGQTPGPPPFQNAISNLDASSGGLRYRWVIHGIQIDCGGGLSGVADNTAITQLVGVQPPDKPKRGTSVDVDGGLFSWLLDTDLTLTFLRTLVAA